MTVGEGGIGGRYWEEQLWKIIKYELAPLPGSAQIQTNQKYKRKPTDSIQTNQSTGGKEKWGVFYAVYQMSTIIHAIYYELMMKRSSPRLHTT